MVKAHHRIPSHQPKFKYWRLSQLFFALFLTLLVLHSVFAIDGQTDRLANTHIVNGIDAQLALIAASTQLLIQQTNNKHKRQRNIAKKQLNTLSKTLNKQAEIAQVNFYNQHGQTIIEAEADAKPLDAYLPIGSNNSQPEYEKGHEVHIQALYGTSNELIGFVEVVINKYRFTGMLDTTKRKNDQKIRIILFCSLFIGVFLTKAFSRKHKFPKFNKQKIRP